MEDDVAIDGKNYACFSNNFAKIFMMACSELDSLADTFAKKIIDDCKLERKAPNTFPRRIDNILNYKKNIKNIRVTTNKDICNMNFVPYNKFNENEADEWWRDYNLVKHNRTETNTGGKYNYEKANLKNTMLALSALYLLCCIVSEYINEGECKLIPDSSLFELV